jgi:hypothetical protein
VGLSGTIPPSIANPISGFGPGDAIVFSAVPFAVGDHAVDTSGKVVVETSASTIVASFNVSSGTLANFKVAPDGSGLKVTDPTSAAGFARASPSSVSSVSDLLGQYGSELAAQSSFPANDPLTFDAWTALSPSAGVDPDGFVFHGAPNPSGTGLLLGADLGGPREASSFGVALNSYGHGPGQSG